MREPPRERMEAAVSRARKRFPDADEFKALWTPASSNEINVEVWQDGSAKVVAA